jgi:hypothetical protein
MTTKIYGGITRAILERIRTDMGKGGVTVPAGDDVTFTATHSVVLRAVYSESDQNLTITIVQKPFYVVASQIWSALDESINQYHTKAVVGIFEEKAALVMEEMPKSAISPETLYLIVQLLIEVIKLYRDCKKSPQALSSMRSPSFMDRWRFRKLAKVHFAGESSAVVEACYKMAKNLTLSDVDRMYEE